MGDCKAQPGAHAETTSGLTAQGLSSGSAEPQPEPAGLCEGKKLRDGAAGSASWLCRKELEGGKEQG